MAFKNLKISCVKAEGNCSRTKVGATFYVRNAKLEIPAGESICIFALGSILQPITGALINNKAGEGLLDVLDQWQCPDPLAKVIFGIEEEKPNGK
ncbi:MAG: TIGR04076 family protein [Planctomycetota bacterium]